MSKGTSKMRNPSPLEVQRRATQQQILQTNLTVLVRHDPRFQNQSHAPAPLPSPPSSPPPCLEPFVQCAVAGRSPLLYTSTHPLSTSLRTAPSASCCMSGPLLSGPPVLGLPPHHSLPRAPSPPFPSHYTSWHFPHCWCQRCMHVRGIKINTFIWLPVASRGKVFAKVPSRLCVSLAIQQSQPPSPWLTDRISQTATSAVSLKSSTWLDTSWCTASTCRRR